jgi:hypothetical protein
MSDLQEVIASTSIKAYNEGMNRERNHIVNLLREFKEKTECECTGCDSWKNAFDWLMLELQNEDL